MLRPIDAYTLNNALVSWYNDTEGETEKSILRRVMQMVVHAPIRKTRRTSDSPDICMY